MGVNRSNTEQFQLRLPPGLRDRIKIYAEQHGRSTNAEIVRILEREFPEPESFSITLEKIRGMIKMLEHGIDRSSWGALEAELEQALKSAVSGKVTDFPNREDLKHALEKWEEIGNDIEYVRAIADYDEEELHSLNSFGTSAKIVQAFPGQDEPTASIRDPFSEKE